jgi:hypothetical protein
MGHWLDQAARELASGRSSRRELIRRAGAVAGGAILASIRLPSPALAQNAAGVPCPDFDSPCFSPDVCCGESCITPSAHLGCCHGQTYDPKLEKCCSKAGADVHACFNDEQCCGATECCKHGEECCSSGKLAYCAKKGQCCPKGQHRVACGHGPSICCPENQYCCNGACATKEQCCGTTLCGKGQHCCHGKQCCTGPCCKTSCCVGKDDQCCSNNGGCCGPKDICCPSGCCIYGCDANGGCAVPPGVAPDIARPPTLRRLDA